MRNYSAIFLRTVSGKRTKSNDGINPLYTVRHVPAYFSDKLVVFTVASNGCLPYGIFDLHPIID